MRKQVKFLFRLLLGEAIAVVFLLILFAVSASAQQQPSDFAADLAPPVYQTTGGIWVAYGFLYPAGTFDNLPPCALPPSDVFPIGSYKITGSGSPSYHAGTYVVRFGNPNDGRQFVFAGIVQFNTTELGLPETTIYSAARLTRASLEADWMAEFTPRSEVCFGASVRISLPQP